jgi:alpha-glucosidase
MRDFGYDVADYRTVDPRFGTLGQLDQVIEGAHKLGLRVLIDQVWSHTSADHPWFSASAASRSGSYADWYVWADPHDDGTPPNNWLSVFGGSAWHWGPSRRQYYLHHFLESQPKLNLRNEAVLQAHFANAEYWLARGIDGFRLDAVDFLLHDEALRENPPHSPIAGSRWWNPFRLQRHLHDMCHPDADRLLIRFREFMDRFPEAILLGEVSSEAGALGRAAAMTGEQRLQMAYTLSVMKSEFSPDTFRQAIVETVSGKRDGSLCWSFSNHDVSRVVSRWNPDSVEQQAFIGLQLALLLCLPGGVSLYQGEELGLPDARLSLQQIRDPFGLAFYPAYAGRDASRTPMPWQAGARNCGFSGASETWLPLAPEHSPLAVDRQESIPTSTLNRYRSVLAWRKRHPALMSGDLTFVDLPLPLLAFRRNSDSESILACFNLSSQPAEVNEQQIPRFSATTELEFVTVPENGRLRT